MKNRLPLAVRVQRVLLWFLFVMMIGNGLMLILETGGGAFGIGYASPYFALGSFMAVLAAKIKSGAKWIRISLIVLYSVMIFLQINRFFNGDLGGLIGLLFPIFGLVLVLRRTSREFFAVSWSGA
ncbi:hypothetical protein [Nocardiopsis metallicus]|uniref:Uncharacterized protein n=2 Tax=Nocardiopsis metallicus TaxID=179819 RepID=A0A840WFI4_9ACTN|nr:hypothetical protein [Nocardiopsis metallicus]MBB5495729.1 hypothetical protein [Nocardiopsis metallicus]